MDYMPSKTRSLVQILEKPCVCSKSHIFSPIMMKLSQNVCLDEQVLGGSVVKCLTHNPGVLASSCTGSSGFFRGSVLGQDTSEPSLVLVKSRKAGVEINFCSYLQKIASAMISNLLNTSCY